MGAFAAQPLRALDASGPYPPYLLPLATSRMLSLTSEQPSVEARGVPVRVFDGNLPVLRGCAACPGKLEDCPESSLVARGVTVCKVRSFRRVRVCLQIGQLRIGGFSSSDPLA